MALRVCYNCDSDLHGERCLNGHSLNNEFSVRCPNYINECVRIQISNSTYVHIRRGCFGVHYRAECEQGSSDLEGNLQRQCNICKRNRCNSGGIIGYNNLVMSVCVAIVILVNKFKTNYDFNYLYVY